MRVTLNLIAFSLTCTQVCSSEPYKFPFVDYEKRQKIIDSNWGGYALDLDLWEDTKSPIVEIRPSTVSLDDTECCGFLSDRLMGVNSSFLSRSPENGLYVLGKCVLRNRVLSKCA